MSARRTRSALSMALASLLTCVAALTGCVPAANAAASSVTIAWSPTSFWTSSVAQAPLDPRSGEMARNLSHQVTSRYGGVAAFNAHHYTNSVVLAPAGTKRYRIAFDNCQNKGWTPAELYSGPAYFVDVPVPDGAEASGGQDANLSIYSPSTDQVWEFWKFQRTATGYSACWGGRIDGASASQGVFPQGWGSSASGLAVASGVITMADIERGWINHVMTIGLPDVARWDDFSWPANRSDGGGGGIIREGQRLRLDPSVDVDRLNLHPVSRMIAKAAQTYGFIVSDQSGAVSLQAEYRGPHTGSDAWSRALGSTPTYAVLQHFPWDRMQVIQKDHGRTTPAPQATPPGGAPAPAPAPIAKPATPAVIETPEAGTPLATVTWGGCTSFSVDTKNLPKGWRADVHWGSGWTRIDAGRSWWSGPKGFVKSVTVSSRDATGKKVGPSRTTARTSC